MPAAAAVDFGSTVILPDSLWESIADSCVTLRWHFFEAMLRMRGRWQLHIGRPQYRQKRLGSSLSNWLSFTEIPDGLLLGPESVFEQTDKSSRISTCSF